MFIDYILKHRISKKIIYYIAQEMYHIKKQSFNTKNLNEILYKDAQINNNSSNLIIYTIFYPVNF